MIKEIGHILLEVIAFIILIVIPVIGMFLLARVIMKLD